MNFCEQRDDFLWEKLHGAIAFLSFRGVRSAVGVGLFAVVLSVGFEVTANRKLVRRDRSPLFFTVLKAKGDAALKRSCVLIGGLRSILSPVRSLESFKRALKTDKGVMAGLGWGRGGIGVFCAGCDHGRRVKDEVVDCGESS